MVKVTSFVWKVSCTKPRMRLNTFISSNRMVTRHVTVALMTSTILHFIVFPALLCSTVHSPYFSDLEGLKRGLELLKNRTADCTKMAKEFWRGVPPKGARSREGGPIRLLILTVTVKRDGQDFVLHTTRRIWQGIQSLGIEEKVELAVCNGSPESHETVRSHLAEKVPVINISCENRTHHCYHSNQW